MAVKINPTFLLKGVEPNRVLIDYNDGVFNRATSEIMMTKFVGGGTKDVLAPTYSKSNKEAIFAIKDRNNNDIVLASSNHKSFEVYTKTGGDLRTGGRCKYCLADFQHTIIGYPLAHEEHMYLINNTYKYKDVFWVEGCFCSFECAAGFLEMFHETDVTRAHSRELLEYLYKLTYPLNGSLISKNDPDLLDIHGGSLTYEQWSDKRHKYLRTDRIILIPAKTIFLKQEC